MITLMGKIIIFFYIIMPRRKKTPLLQHGGAGPTDECPICLESGSIQSDFLGTDYPMIQYCPNGHWAHIPCISQWLGTFSTSVDEGKVCPLCRENLSSTDLWININTSCKICGEQGTARIVDKPEIDYLMLPHCPNGHWSHEPCISTWLNGSYSCPNCERDLRNTTVWKKVNPNGNTSLKYQNNITDSLKDIQEKIKSNGKWKSIRNIGRNQPAPAQESLGIRSTGTTCTFERNYLYNCSKKLRWCMGTFSSYGWYRRMYRLCYLLLEHLSSKVTKPVKNYGYRRKSYSNQGQN